MAKVGYARVSTTYQDYDLQLIALKQAGCEEIFSETDSGASAKEKSKLQKCLTYLSRGDTLVVTRIDRLARSLRELENLISQLKEKQVEVKITAQGINTSNASGKVFLEMLSMFSEFETNVKKEKQMNGISKAKAQGKFKGRKPTALAKSNKAIDLIDRGWTRKAVAEELNIGIASVYRILKNKKHDRKQQILSEINLQRVKQ